MNTIEVCLSPLLFGTRITRGEHLVVIVDVLRATSAFCAAFDSGVEEIIPLTGLEHLYEYKERGYLIAAEREGQKVDFADFGNSPVVFLDSDLKSKKLGYSTTNGTQAIELAKSSGNIVAAAFVNLDSACRWISRQHMDVVILCSGWKNSFSLEDTLCAGAIIELLMYTGIFEPASDSALSALALWIDMKDSLDNNVSKASHYKCLLEIGLLDDLQHCFRLNSSKVVPVWNGTSFRNAESEKVQ